MSGTVDLLMSGTVDLLMIAPIGFTDALVPRSRGDLGGEFA